MDRDPCEIVASNLRSYSGNESTMYRVDILYRYTFGGRTHRSNCYGFFGGSSSTRDWKERAVRAHPAGSRTVCYVNPDDPFEAVLDRSWNADMLFGLIPGVFVLVGGIGVFFTTRSIVRGRTFPRSAPSWQPRLRADRRDFPEEPGSAARGEPVTFTVGKSRVGKLLATVFFAAFWNGIVSVFLVQLVNGWRNGRPDYFLTVFLIPFVVVGLGAIGAIFYYALGLLTRISQMAIEVCPCALRFGPIECPCSWRSAPSVGRT